VAETVAASPKTPSEREAWRGPELLTGGAFHEGSVRANRLGLQVARAIAMNRDFARRRRTVDAAFRAYVEEFDRDGALTIENFLPADVFEQVRAEAEAAYEDGAPFKSEVVEDNSVIEEILKINKARDRFSATCEHVAENERLASLMATLARRPELLRLTVAVSYMHKDANAPAPVRLVGSNYIHADVHYPSVKAWLLLDDIDEHNGAFVYAKGSQRLTLARLAYEYDASVRVAKSKQEGTLRTSIPYGFVRMPTEGQLRRMGIRETALGGAPNTLVVASVMGFHRRGEFDEGRWRKQLAITFSDRPKDRPT
jgi:Phytanoyl-CoA dioxygenase (PhyH)